MENVLTFKMNLDKYMTIARKLITSKKLKYLVQCLKATPNQGIFYSRSNSLPLTAYSNANWATCPTTGRLVTGFITVRIEFEPSRAELA